MLRYLSKQILFRSHERRINKTHLIDRKQQKCFLAALNRYCSCLIVSVRFSPKSLQLFLVLFELETLVLLLCYCELFCDVFHCTVLYCTVLFCIVLSVLYCHNGTISAYIWDNPAEDEIFLSEMSPIGATSAFMNLLNCLSYRLLLLHESTSIQAKAGFCPILPRIKFYHM